MANIQSIKRDEAYEPFIVRIISEDTLAAVGTTGYLLAQASVIAALNEGAFEWVESDMALVYASDGWGFFQVASDFESLIPFDSVGGTVDIIGAPVVVGDFAVFQATSGNIEDLGYLPSDAAKTKVVMAGSAVVVNNIAHFVDTGGTIDDTAAAVTNMGNIYAGASGTAGVLRSYSATGTRGYFGITAIANAADYAAILSNASLGQSTTWSLIDPGASTANIILSVSPAGQTVNFSSSSATPGTVRSLVGKATVSNATYANTTNSVAGLRGEIAMVGASSGFLYGVQGKVIPTGTLSGSIWAPAVFGQYDLSAATLNAGQIAAIWGDMGATGGTFTDVTGARMFAGTNTIDSLVLNSMIYLYGRCTSLLELSGDTSNYISAGGATASGTIKKIAITIGGVQYYLQAATVYS